MSILSWYIRKSWAKGDAKRDAGLKTPEDILRYDDISYGPHKMHVLDVYRPKNKEGKLPVIVSVHGGAWVYGDKELYQHYCMNLAQRGFAVVNFTYRLSPESKYPCHLEDTVSVFQWTLEHASEYGFDTENIFAVGDSAGAHILALFCCMCTNPEYAKRYTFRAPEGFVPKAVGLNCGFYDLATPQPGGAPTGWLMREILPKKGSKEEKELISPILHVTKDFPPCYIMTANEDFLKDQQPVLTKALDACGAKYTYKMYGDENDRLGHVFHVDMNKATGKICNDEQCAWFLAQ